MLQEEKSGRVKERENMEGVWDGMGKTGARMNDKARKQWGGGCKFSREM